MKVLANGPLETGTYIAYPVSLPGQFHGLRQSDNQTKVTLTENEDHEGVKWQIESLGDHKYRVNNKHTNTGPSPHPEDHTAANFVEGGMEWIVKPTDIEGEYTASPASHPTLYPSATSNEGTVNFGSEAQLMRWKVFRVDND